MKSKKMALNHGHPCSIPMRAALWIGVILMLCPMVLLTGGDSEADIYQYKDKNGSWVITDTPPDNVAETKVIRDKVRQSSRSSGFRDIERNLSEKFNPQSEIETASLSTVTIKTSMGVGSGFFINEDGYILTNRHVLRGDDAQIKRAEEFIARTDDQFGDSEAILADGEKQLNTMRGNLAHFKAQIDRMTDPQEREIAMRNYRSKSEQCDLFEGLLKKRKRELEERLSKYREEKGEFARRTKTAQQDRQFTVVLKDQTELDADLVSVSEKHDLALLRINGCRSPYIRSGAQNRLAQGMKVFAIGTPMGVGDSVSAGIISGYNSDYIRTDARIYPGNSGGPLITADGKVVGINTMKLMNQRFEGIGFAIPVRRALQEFGRYLKIDH